MADDWYATQTSVDEQVAQDSVEKSLHGREKRQYKERGGKIHGLLGTALMRTIRR